MKVIHLNHSDMQGGAARAAFRIHEALLAAEVDSTMWVNKKISNVDSVVGPSNRYLETLNAARMILPRQIKRMSKTSDPVLRSLNILPSSWPEKINSSDADIVNLHWIGGEMMSLKDIARIDKPLVWTIHDMWPFCGAEHYSDTGRWQEGYTVENRPDYESGFDLNRWIWRKKRSLWTDPIPVIANSDWIRSCVANSALMRNWPAKFIHLPLNLSFWKPENKAVCRQILGVPADKPIIAFGAMGGVSDSRKGFDLLLQALKVLGGLRSDIHLLVFGQDRTEAAETFGYSATFTGHLKDNSSMKVAYCAADVMVVPSRQEAFGQTASEAQACGTPVVAFDIGGLPNTVEHLSTGYLAKPFDTEDLATGIEWVLQNLANGSECKAARDKAHLDADSSRIARKYIEHYQGVLNNY